MADRLRGRTIVITGGASGIGAALATGFAAEGANAVIADLNLEAADALVAEIRSTGGSASAVRVDVTDREVGAHRHLGRVERHGRLDAYFNNAGMNAPMKFLDITEENFELVMRVNALGVLIGIQEAAKQFIAQGGGGKVVNTASIAGRQGFSSFAPYSAAKAGGHLAHPGRRARARRARHHGQRLRAGRGGDAAVDQARPRARRDRRGPERLRLDGERHPPRPPRRPADIVPTGIFLAASDSDYITGQIIPIEGGMILV